MVPAVSHNASEQGTPAFPRCKCDRLLLHRGRRFLCFLVVTSPSSSGSQEGPRTPAYCPGRRQQRRQDWPVDVDGGVGQPPGRAAAAHHGPGKWGGRRAAAADSVYFQGMEASG